MKPLGLRSAIALVATAIAVLTLPASAPAIKGEITRADASPDWTHGSIAGWVSSDDTIWLQIAVAWAEVIPNGAVCEAYPLPQYQRPGTERVWESDILDQNPSFDIPDVQLHSGVSPRICLYAYYDYTFLPTQATLLVASRIFAALPAPVTPKPPPGPAPKTAAVTLSRTTAYAKAKSALKARYGRAYRRGKRKRLSCAKRSATRYRCTYSFRYRKKSRKGFVTVTIKPNGSVTTKVKRR